MLRTLLISSTICLFLTNPFGLNAQDNNKLIKVILKDKMSKTIVPYAHISSSNQLVAISDFMGRIILNENQGNSFRVTCIGYLSVDFTLQELEKTEANTVWLIPDKKILETVTITPTTLEDMIEAVYKNIPNAYQTKPHLLEGTLVENYKDTSGHIHISSTAKAYVHKSAYLKSQFGGRVKIDSLVRKYDVRDTLSYQISAGAHIPHRFDFVMRREEFIKPSAFDKYHYSYLGEQEYGDRLVEIIGFEPKSNGLASGKFLGKMYLDMEEKVFVKAEYEYTKFGFLSNSGSRWADQRMFITEYKPSSSGWYFYYTWDEAVNLKKSFLLSQNFRTTSMTPDTLTDWNYEEQMQYIDAVESEVADTVIVTNRADLSPSKQFKRKRQILEFIKRIETPLGLKVYTLNTQILSTNADLNYKDETFSINESFDISAIDIGFYASIRYRIKPNFFLQINQSENYNRSVRKRSWDIGVAYRLNFKTVRPTDLNFSASYAEFKNQFLFNKQLGVTPVYQQKHQGLAVGLNYEIRLNPKWKIGFSYNYFYSFDTKERFYLKEKYGLFNWFSKRHDYPVESVVWQRDNEQITPDVFDKHSFDVMLVLSLE